MDNNKINEMIWKSGERKSINVFSNYTSWKRYDNYKITNDNQKFPKIIPDSSSTFSLYDPFECYPNILLDYIKLTIDVVKDIGFEVDMNSINITSPNYEIYYNDKNVLKSIAKRLLRFIKDYGLFYHYYDDDQIYNERTYIDTNSQLKGSGEGFISEGETVQEVINRLLTHYIMFIDVYQFMSSGLELTDDYMNSTNTWGEKLSAILVVDNIGLTVKHTSNGPKLAWKYNDLYKAIHIMFINNMTIDKNPIRLCALSTCNMPFIPNNNTHKYCVTNCSNTDRQRRNRNKKKQEREENNG